LEALVTVGERAFINFVSASLGAVAATGNTALRLFFDWINVSVLPRRFAKMTSIRNQLDPTRNALIDAIRRICLKIRQMHFADGLGGVRRKVG
jgi:hypothetical protein